MSIVTAELTAPAGKAATIVTIWIVEHGEAGPRLVTAKPLGLNMTATFNELDTVVLTHDVKDSNLKAGDLGAIVLVLAPDAFEVEFVKALGRTQAVLTLSSKDIRPVAEDDVLSVRKARPV